MLSMLYVNNITNYEVNNGPGFRTCVWFSGCSLRCKGCHNPYLWDKANGTPLSWQELAERLKGETRITLLGGEPFDQDIEDLENLLKHLPNANIWVYTGYEYRDLMQKYPNIFKYINVLVDGPYIEDLRNTSLAFRGSENQQIIFINNE